MYDISAAHACFSKYKSISDQAPCVSRLVHPGFPFPFPDFIKHAALWSNSVTAVSGPIARIEGPAGHSLTSPSGAKHNSALVPQTLFMYDMIFAHSCFWLE